MTNTSWSDTGLEQVYDIAVVIGRFQPLHNAHVKLIEYARQSAKNVLVLVGSSFIARDIRNPFTFEEREEMIRSCFPSNNEPDSFEVMPLVDQMYNDQLWFSTVQDEVDKYAELLNIDRPKVALIGHRKDDTSFYLDHFPKWKLLECDRFVEHHDGTYIRNAYLSTTFDQLGKPLNYIPTNSIPKTTYDFLDEFRHRDVYKQLCSEYVFNRKYKQQFENYPYPPIFVTTDAVVICNGNILLVKRRSEPGKGLWALPGGFLEQNLKIEDNMIKELYEETKIKVSERIMRASLRNTHVFDAPRRSLRGRTITHAGLFLLNQRDLPIVKGSDDAEKAKWVPIAEFYQMTDQLFEDHYSIGQYMITRAG